MVAGILAGLQILVPQKKYKRIDKFLLEGMKDTVTKKGSLRWLWIIFTLLIVVAIILIIEIPAFNTDIKNGVLKTHILSTITLIVGFLVGMFVSIVLARIDRTKGVFKDLSPTEIGPIAGFIVAGITFGLGIFLANLSSSYPTIVIVSFLIAFAASSMIMALVIWFMPHAKKFLTFQSGVLLRIGVILFIIARIIELKIS